MMQWSLCRLLVVSYSFFWSSDRIIEFEYLLIIDCIRDSSLAARTTFDSQLKGNGRGTLYRNARSRLRYKQQVESGTFLFCLFSQQHVSIRNHLAQSGRVLCRRPQEAWTAGNRRLAYDGQEATEQDDCKLPCGLGVDHLPMGEFLAFQWSSP